MVLNFNRRNEEWMVHRHFDCCSVYFVVDGNPRLTLMCLYCNLFFVTYCYIPVCNMGTIAHHISY